MIELSQLEEMFASIEANTDWNAKEPLLWGYFFADRSEQKLRALVPQLEGDAYRFVDLYVPEAVGGQQEEFILHMEKEEVHTADSLHVRNQELDALAQRLGLDRYDGMDVGPVLR